jgi:hypothetical protein
MILSLLLAAALEMNSFDQLIKQYGLPAGGTFDPQTETTTFGFCRSGEVLEYAYVWPEKNLKLLSGPEASGNFCCGCNIRSDSYSKSVREDIARTIEEAPCKGARFDSIAALARKHGPPMAILTDCKCEKKKCTCPGTIQEWTFRSKELEGGFFDVIVDEQFKTRCIGRDYSIEP